MGRAPTSGYCHTCRKRRVKCDRGQPECQRCVRSGHKCLGYESVLRMQNHAVVAGSVPGSSRLERIQRMTSFPPIAVAHHTKKSGHGKTSTSARQTTAQQTDGSMAFPNLEFGEALPGPRGQRSRDGRDETIYFSDLSLAGFSDDMAFSYFFQSYGWINMHSILLQDAGLQGRLGDNRLAYNSLRALCYGLLGRDMSIVPLQNAGRRIYGQAIRDLQARITTPSKHDLAALVKPISLMGSYSIVVEKDFHFTHHTGLARILQLCGPTYFQSPNLLPVFESVRWTLISDAMVRRETTFLDAPEWKTEPWASCPESKSAFNKLLDLLASIPTIHHGVVQILKDREQWILNGGARIESPDAVQKLQDLVIRLTAASEAWRYGWEQKYPDTAPHVLQWALSQVGHASYEPGIQGMEGPDAYETLLANISIESLLTEWVDSHRPYSEATTVLATRMQEAALYITVVIWTNRMNKYLAGAARSPTCTDFYTMSFHTSCTCVNSAPLQRCETRLPAEMAPGIDPPLAWNAGTCAVAAAPVRVCSSHCNKTPQSPPASHSDLIPASPSMVPDLNASRLKPTVIFPSDVRFAGHLRILSWLCSRLPSTRTQVLATLAAIGLGHCAHDGRPADGIAEVAAIAVARVFDSTRFDGATDILLRSYRQAM